MEYGASAYASLLMVMTAVFLLITAQLAVTSSELRVSQMHERYDGLYETGVSAAQARVREMNGALVGVSGEILRAYMENYDWESQCEPDGGVLVLTGEAFGQAYREIAPRYLEAEPDTTAVITQESGLEIGIQTVFGSPGGSFRISVTNNNPRPYVKNMTGAVNVEGQIIWNPEPPVYTLQPLFNISEDTWEGKSFADFTVLDDPGYKAIILSAVHRS